MYAKSLSFFELSTVFLPKAAGQQPDELLTLSILVVRPKDAYRAVKGILDLISAKLNIELDIKSSDPSHLYAPDRSGNIYSHAQHLGRIGQLEPELARKHKLPGEVAVLELAVDELLNFSAVVAATIGERYPVTLRDLTVYIPQEVQWQSVRGSLAEVLGLQTLYRSEYIGDSVPDGHKSLSIHLRISGIDHTPTEAEAADVETKVRSILRRSFKALPTD